MTGFSSKFAMPIMLYSLTLSWGVETNEVEAKAKATGLSGDWKLK